MQHLNPTWRRVNITVEDFACSRPLLWGGFVLAACLALLLLRNPYTLVDPQLYAEDGLVWYPDAYRFGHASLFMPSNGYLNVLQHLVAWICMRLVPLNYVPFVFNLVALFVDALPVVILLSNRGQAVVQPLWPRMAFALTVLFLPSIFETVGNLTGAPWHLALSAFLVIVLKPPRTTAGRAADIAIILLSGLSGPFCCLLAPIALAMAIRQPSRTSITYLAIVSACVLAQFAFLLNMDAVRADAPLGAGVDVLLRIVTLQVLAGTEFGVGGMGFFHANLYWANNILPMLFLFLATLAVAWSLAELRLPLLLFLLFAGLEMTAALLRPQVSFTEPQWLLMQTPGIANRYYSYPAIAWLVVIFGLLASTRPQRKALGVALLLPIALFAIPTNFFLPRMPHTNFQELATAFKTAPSGTTVTFPIYPPGWEMKLTKR